MAVRTKQKENATNFDPFVNVVRLYLKYTFLTTHFDFWGSVHIFCKQRQC